MEDIDSYYTINSENYNNLIKKLNPLIRECLTEENILIQSVQSRIKDRDSFKDKIVRRNYTEPSQVKDLLGIRVICYVNSDVRKIVDILHDNFDVSEVEDKSEGLGINVVGYKAIHLNCSLPKQRCDLPEFSKFRFLYLKYK